MWIVLTKFIQRAGLLALGSGGTILSLGCSQALAQIFLAPNQQFPQGSRVSIDVGNVRCNSDGGSLPNLSVSAGAYPDHLGNNINVSQQNSNSSIGNQSSLMALLSLNIPLKSSNPQFSCLSLLKDAQFKTRMENLRQLVDEEVISESQYKKALVHLFGPLSSSALELPKSPAQGVSLVVP
jgi:hypothetical protein